MNKEHKPSKLKLVIEPLEKFLFFSAVILWILFYTQIIQSQTILVLNLAGLAIVFFISAFIPIELFDSQEEADEYGEMGFLDLFVTGIAPKVMWISSSVSVFGLIMYFTRPELGSYVRMAMIGGSTILICLIIFGFGILSGMKLHKSIYKVVLRGVPLLLINYFLLFETTYGL